MTLVVEIANNKVKELLANYGKVVYESRILDLVYLELYNEEQKKLILELPGVLSIEEESAGKLMSL